MLSWIVAILLVVLALKVAKKIVKVALFVSACLLVANALGVFA